MSTRPVHPDLFTADGRLRGGYSATSGRAHFPYQPVCPFSGADDVEEVALAEEGTLWAWTAVTAAPPGYRGEVPFGFGVVELPDGLRVLTRLTVADPAELRFGQRMRLVTVPLHRADDGAQIITYAFTPAAGGAA